MGNKDKMKERHRGRDRETHTWSR